MDYLTAERKSSGSRSFTGGDDDEGAGLGPASSVPVLRNAQTPGAIFILIAEFN
jgi:hypothetical protein